MRAIRIGNIVVLAVVVGRVASAAESVVESLSSAPRAAAIAAPGLADANLIACARVADVPGTAVGPGTVVPGATVILIAPDGKVYAATAGSDGCAGFVALPAGKYKITVASPGAEPVDGETQVPAEGVARFDASLALLAADGQEVIVEASREGAGETRRTIKPREVRNIPGAANDALKSVQNLPGVARAPMGLGMLVVRGAAPGDTRVFLDGQEIPQLYHFGGVASVIPTEALSRIDFLPGGFGVRYGRTVGGVVDVESRAGRDDKAGGFFDADFYGAAGLAEGPLGRDGKNGRVLAGVRRSYVDAVLPLFTPAGGDLSWTVAPRFYDYQMRYDPAVGESGLQSHVMAFGSDDAFTFVVKKPDADGLRGRYGFRTSFHRLQAPIAKPLGNGWILSGVPSMGYQNLTLDGGGLVTLTGSRVTGGARIEARGPITKRANLLVGADGELQRIGYSADYVDDGGTGATSPDRRRIASAEYASSAAGAYAEGEFDTGNGWVFVPGVRVDHYQPANAWTVDPRLAARWRFEEHSWAKAYGGIYHQPPDFYEWDREVGTPGLRPAMAVQTGLGGGHDFEKATVEGEIFYKWLDDLPSQTKGDASDPTQKSSYNNGGIGRAYGMEMLVRRDLSQRLSGWVAYTLSKSERASPKNGWNMFRYDQTHIFSAVAAYRLRRGWQAAARFRYVTGNPTTRVEEAVYDADGDRYLPVPGFRSESRLPSFHQLDVRIEKTWDWSGWDLSGYIDVQNVYGRLNPERQRYDFDYSESGYVTGLPIFPSIGIRGEF